MIHQQNAKKHATANSAVNPSPATNISTVKRGPSSDLTRSSPTFPILMPTDVEIAPAFIATHRIIVQLGTCGANLWCLRGRLSGGGGDRPRRRRLRGGLPALLKWDWGNYRGLRRWLVADDPYRSDRTSDQTGWGMIRCLIFACVEQDPQRSNAAQAACGYRVLQREHQL